MGRAIAVIGEAGRGAIASRSPGARRSCPPAAALAAAPAAGAAAPLRPRRVKASPLARRIAAELGVDLATLAGSGPHGRVIRADVERSAAGAIATQRRQRPVAQAQPRASRPARS